MHAVLTESKKSQRGMPIFPAFINNTGTAKPRELKRKLKKYSPISKPTPANINSPPLIKTAMAASSNGLFASEVNTKDGVPK